MLFHLIAFHSRRVSVHPLTRFFRLLFRCMDHANQRYTVNCFDNAVNRIHVVNSRGQNRTKSTLPQSSTIANEIFCGFSDLFTIYLLFLYYRVTISLLSFWQDSKSYASLVPFALPFWHCQDGSRFGMEFASGHAFLRHRYGRSAAAMNGNHASFGVFVHDLNLPCSLLDVSLRPPTARGAVSRPPHTSPVNP